MGKGGNIDNGVISVITIGNIYWSIGLLVYWSIFSLLISFLSSFFILISTFDIIKKSGDSLRF